MMQNRANEKQLSFSMKFGSMVMVAKIWPGLKRHCNRWYIKGLRHPSGKGERLIIFGAECEMCVGFSTLHLPF